MIFKAKVAGLSVLALIVSALCYGASAQSVAKENGLDHSPSGMISTLGWVFLLIICVLAVIVIRKLIIVRRIRRETKSTPPEYHPW